jgi:hypothetical protein
MSLREGASNRFANGLPHKLRPLCSLCGRAIDSEETMQFSARFGVKPHVETFPLEPRTWKASTAASRFSPSSIEFDAWLEATVALPDDERRRAFVGWRDAPGASDAHDTDDHFVPLIVAAGAGAGHGGLVVYRDRPFAGIAQSMFRFG